MAGKRYALCKAYCSKSTNQRHVENAWGAKFWLCLKCLQVWEVTQ